MNFFEKIGLVERTDLEQEQNTADIQEPLPKDLSIDSVDISSQPDEFLENVYGLCQDDKKILDKVVEMISALPNDMPQKTKQQVVKGIIPVTGLSEESILASLQNINSVIGQKQMEMVDNISARIEEIKVNIEEMKNAIQCAQKQCEDEENCIVSINNSAKVESEKISAIISFIGGIEK